MITHLQAPVEVARWLQALGVRALRSDSRRIGPGEGFVAWPGAAVDARRYVADAFGAGARACVVERDGVERWAWGDAPVATLEGLKASAGELAHHFYREPSAAVRVAAITGTNGKTSTAWWIAQLLSALERPCGVAGTLGMGRPGEVLAPTGLTTPDPIVLHTGLREFADRGLKACALEASSIGIVEGRLSGTRVHTAVFTNLTQDHLDYHGSMEAYWAAKRRLFDWPGLRVAVVNIDDPRGEALAAELSASARHGDPLQAVTVWTLSTQGAPARLHVPEWTFTDTGLSFTVAESLPSGTEGPQQRLKLPLVGDYNLYNLLAAIAVARAWGYALADIARACAQLSPVPGRMQAAMAGAAAEGQPHVLVDYAHTPDALEKALRALQPLALQRGGRLWCVFGCGGDRDRGKRPLMAAAAEREAAMVVLTSDNPRSEEPQAILDEMRRGLRSPASALACADRAEAIAQAVALAQPADVILIAGKGHEDYQEVAGVRRPFSDLAEARRALARRAASPEARA